MKIIEKVAFLVHEPTLYAHYANVWAEMCPEDFVVVLLGPIARLGGGADVHSQSFIDKIKASKYEIVYLDEIVRKQIKYRNVVSNHIMGGSSAQPKAFTSWERLKRWLVSLMKAGVNSMLRMVGLPRKYAYNIDPLQYPPLQAGIRQIRFMYGADISDAWSLDEWNSIYDLFLCHGPNDERCLNTRFKGRTVTMGYPRYDGYFSDDLKTDSIVAEFGIDPRKKTLLWMPTFDAFKDNVCSIPFFAETLARLKVDFNIIVRPHPISFREDPAGIELLQSLNFNIDSDPMRDMNALFRVADTVLCDHGGSAFGALYLSKKLIFLKTPTKKTATVVSESSNVELMRHFPTVEANEIDQLGSLIQDEAYWQEKLSESRTLSDIYFANYRGNSAKKAATMLGSLDSIFFRGGAGSA